MASVIWKHEKQLFSVKVLNKVISGIAVIAVALTGKTFFVYSYVQARLMGSFMC